MLFYKLELPYSREQEARVVETFCKTESEIPTTIEEMGVDPSIVALASRLLRRLLLGFNPQNIRPKHGPGAVATGERGNGKYYFRRKYQRLHQEFPYYRFFSASLSRNSFESGWYTKLEPALNPLAKVVLVPKDSRGPRLISMEPLEVQWIQQGQHKTLVRLIESHPLTKGRVNFTNQSLNRELAYSSSLDKEYSTLDLKEASDRVSCALFDALFPEHVRKAWYACRSTATELPNGTILPLRKFAPMGSALCFPVMSLTIWALTEATLRLKHRSHNSRFLVFGDDLIVPTAGFEDVVTTLESTGLLVNKDKSFSRSFFRESCGMDAYMGQVVTPLRFKRVVDRRRPSHSLYAHLIELSEAFFNKGYWSTCRFLREETRQLYGRVPWTSRLGGLGHYCPDPDVCDSRNTGIPSRWKSKFQRVELRIPSVVSVKDDSKLPFYTTRLLKGLLGLYRRDEENEKVTLRGKCVLARRWACVH
jgi:hypothetical protein